MLNLLWTDDCEACVAPFDMIGRALISSVTGEILPFSIEALSKISTRIRHVPAPSFTFYLHEMVCCFVHAHAVTLDALYASCLSNRQDDAAYDYFCALTFTRLTTQASSLHPPGSPLVRLRRGGRWKTSHVPASCSYCIRVMRLGK